MHGLLCDMVLKNQSHRQTHLNLQYISLFSVIAIEMIFRSWALKSSKLSQ